jgi:hypothetical protein
MGALPPAPALAALHAGAACRQGVMHATCHHR